MPLRGYVFHLNNKQGGSLNDINSDINITSSVIHFYDLNYKCARKKWIQNNINGIRKTLPYELCMGLHHSS
jgi:hypothetical protein